MSKAALQDSLSVDKHYDITIVGGGLVGACLLRALAHLPLKIAVIEAVPYDAQTQPSFDDRAIALSYGSRRIFEGLGVWDSIAPFVTAITDIHVSEQGRFGVTRINAQQEQVAALGYVITARELGQGIVKTLPEQDNADFYLPASLTQLTIDADKARLTIQQEQAEVHLTSRLVIAADGGNSTVRKMLGIGADKTDYQQTAIVTNIQAELPHRHVAYERFTAQGPLALLPMKSHDMAVVWTHNKKSLGEVSDLDDTAFLSALQQKIGSRLGQLVRVGKRFTYPLQLLRVRDQVQHRLALIGNAAHTLHPVAGQGFNLGLRDVAVMAQVLSDAVSAGSDIDDMALLKTYQQWRKQDHKQIIGFTHGLVKVFSNGLTPLATARNLGLVITDLCPPLKHTLAQHTMGLAGRLPRLARGLSPTDRAMP